MKKNDIEISSTRNFGWVFFVVFLFIAFYPLTNHEDTRLWSLFISFIFFFLGLLNSRLLLPLNKLWFKLGIFLGNLISPVVITIVFFNSHSHGIIYETISEGHFKIKKNKAESYWIKVEQGQSKMKNQF